MIDADRFDHRSEQEIERALSGNREVVFARAFTRGKAADRRSAAGRRSRDCDDR